MPARKSATPLPDELRSRSRAEIPPPRYWRRWTTDIADEPTLLPEKLQDPPSATLMPSHQIPSTTTPSESSVSTDADARLEAEEPQTRPYRVLIVEDDRAQGLFAQSILHGAGMLAEVQTAPDAVLQAIRDFKPELVLMDLHLPDVDGMRLTHLIREEPDYKLLPIVFLTGDPNPERQFEVLENGADDFLTKPIRPRHLIAAVSNRIQRARQQALLLQPHERPRVNPETGLPTRTHLLDSISGALRSGAQGGLFFIEIGSALTLRERFGYARFEQLMIDAGRHLARVAAPNPLARLNDNSYLVLALGMQGEATLQTYAHDLRDALAAHPFPMRGEEPLRLQASIGYASLSTDFADPGSALEATERAALQARRQPGSVAAYVPPGSAEEEQRAALEGAEVEFAYQPIVAVAGSDTAQYQVLLRLRLSSGELLSAGQAVPAAESSGLIADLDKQVMEHALGRLADAAQHGPSLRLFVSQSPRTLARGVISEWLLQTLAERKIEGTSLVIDLRLSDALIHIVTLREFCARLMPVGVQFCLSQFEPGREAEAVVAQLPLGYLRLAGRYADSHADPALRDEMRGVIDYAHRQGLQVIGQQIEEPQAAAALWMGGVDFIQGNLVQSVGKDLDFDFHNAVL